MAAVVAKPAQNSKRRRSLPVGHIPVPNSDPLVSLCGQPLLGIKAEVEPCPVCTEIEQLLRHRL
jgi:hypothetical protein